LLQRIEPFTMVPRDALVDLACLVQAVLAYEIPGDFVECGVWRGGASLLMAELLRRAGVRDRKVWMFDSFEGLPPPQEIDGEEALAYAQNTDSPWYHDNCRASVEEVQRLADAMGLAPYTEIVKGWFDQTLPACRRRIGPIAILRIDGNWYDSVRCCLENLYDQVVEDGFVIAHTYYTYDGCALAVNEFLGERRLAHRVEGIVGRSQGAEELQSALFRKGDTTWKWLQQLYGTRQDLAACVPADATLILLDEDWFGSAVAGQRRYFPFLEHKGQYWGPPPDDATAVRELERLRRLGASFMAFVWPTFWWLDYYAGLRRHLRTKYRRVLENSRLVVFDLRP
jgi:hypothetical protein